MIALSFRDPATISYSIGALSFLAFSAHLWPTRHDGLRASILFATVAASALWAGFNLAFALGGNAAVWAAQSVLDALRLGGWLLFAAALLGTRTVSPGTEIREASSAAVEKSARGTWRSTIRRSRWWWAVSIVVLPAAAWLLPFAPPARELSTATTGSRVPYGLFLGVSVAGLVLTEQIFRRVLEQARWSIKPLCLGLGAGFVFDLYMYADALLFGRLDANVWAARGFAQALVIPFIALATARNRQWTLDLALSRGIVLHSTALLASGIYLLAVAGAGYYVRYFGGTWGKTFQIGFIFAAVLLLGLLFSSGTLRSRLKVFVNKNFFPYRYDYREEWLRFTNLLATGSADSSPAQRCIQALANLVESPAGTLWLLGEDRTYAQAARWNLPDIQPHEGADHPLPRFLRDTGWVVNLQEFREQPSRFPGLRLPQWLNDLPSAWLVVPIGAQEELMGFMIITTPRAALDVDWEVRDLLKTAARQIGSFLAQLRASEALLEAKKFDAFNRMAAFVVHDLKNLVAQLSLLLKNAERHRFNPRFQEDVLATVQHVTARMSRLLVQLSTRARGEEDARPVDLGNVARRVVGAKSDQRADIEVKASGNVLAHGSERRFERVIGHLVQNAIDATREGGAITVQVFPDQDCACVEIADSGCGMSEEFVRERLFRPFQTTKPSGMGIGAYETAQYMNEVGGRIVADSRPGAGTRIRLILPLHGSGTTQGQRDRQAA